MLEKIKAYKEDIFILLGTFLMGILFFCFYQEWIVLHISFGTRPPLTFASGSAQKKNYTFFFWKNNRWHKEESEILWSENTEKSLWQLINKWLSLADEEGILSDKIKLQSTTLSDGKKSAYLSFDRSPLNQQSSTLQKYMIIESILYTIKESGLKITDVYFLVDHNHLPDCHLDFSTPWPVTGFLGQK